MTRKHRALTAVAIGFAALSYVLLVGANQPPGAAPDFDQWFAAAYAFRHGDNPYEAVRLAGWAWPLYYPLPTVLAVVPLTYLPLLPARAVFAGIGSGLLAYAVSREGWWRLWLLASGAMLAALYFCQWSPWLVAAALLPWLGGVLTCKPSLGLALGVTYPSWRAAVSVGLMLVVTFAAWPGWVPEWLDAIGGARHLEPPVIRPGGIVLLLALARWRLPEARLLLVMACVPHAVLPHEALPLGLLARSKREAEAFAGLTLIAFVIILRLAPEDTYYHYLAWCWWWMLGLVYLPALGLVLSRPNR